MGWYEQILPEVLAGKTLDPGSRDLVAEEGLLICLWTVFEIFIHSSVKSLC